MGGPLRVVSVVGLGAAVVLGGAALGMGSGVSTDLADTSAVDRDAAWRGDVARRWDMSTTLGWAAAGVGIASAAGFGVSFTGKF